jgi:RNA polymerase sigma-70 factor (ECF subfamily)
VALWGTDRTAVAPSRAGGGGSAAGEHELVSRARGGDVEAFAELYRRCVGRVYAVCRRLAGEPALAEDLTQDVFIRAWEKLGSFRGESAFSSWLHPLAVNVAIGALRARRREVARGPVYEDGTTAEPAAPARPPEMAITLETAMDRLPAGAREVFVLHDVEGFRHEEIGRLTGIAAGTSKAQLHRARRLLREALA